MNWQSTRESQGGETTLYDTLRVHTCHCASVQTQSMYNTKSDPKVNRGLWAIMMYQCRFVNCNKCTIWRRMLIVGKAMHVLRQRVYGKSFYRPLNFAVNLRVL